MDAKEQTKKAYELFSSGDMETFFTVSYTHLTLPTTVDV